MKITLLSKKKEREFNENEIKAEEFNEKYKENKITVKTIFLNQSQDFAVIVYNFIKNYCENAKIKTFLSLEKKFENTIIYDKQKNIILLGIIKNLKNNIYSIKSVIYEDYIFEYNNLLNKKFIDSFELDVKEYDLLVWIQFEKFKLKGNVFKNN